MSKYEVVKQSSNDCAFTNAVYLNSKSKCITGNVNYCKLTSKTLSRVFCVEGDKTLNQSSVGLSKFQRKFLNVEISDIVTIEPYSLKKSDKFIGKLVIRIKILNEKNVPNKEINTDDLCQNFLLLFKSFPFHVGQELALSYNRISLSLEIKEIHVTSVESFQGYDNTSDIKFDSAASGILMSNAQIIFNKSEGSNLILIGKSKEKNTTQRELLAPNWNFSQLGIGGLDHEFSVIFRRAFSSRIFPAEIVQELGLKHVRGILLFGPPGTGKTLLARQIGKMLNSVEPKIINGPEILNKYVGESEANVRKLFEDAERDQISKGLNSPLHLIIFDEIDAICKQRGQGTRSSGVQDTVVNQLLSKIDGVNQLNNILIIGMTNRRDLIDSALLRPGRFEIQLEIGLPDLKGRAQILNIHTENLRKFNKLDDSVDLNTIAELSKNFSGAEIEGLVRAATTTAMNRLVKFEDGKISTVSNNDEFENFLVKQGDFENSLKYDIKPAFGVNIDYQTNLQKYISNGIIIWSEAISKTIEKLHLMIDQTRNGKLISPVSVLIEGDDGAGKTALAVALALKSDFPMIKFCTPEDMIGMNEYEKCDYLNKIFNDLNKSELSCIVIDNIERIFDYVAIGPRFANTILQTLFVLIKRKMEFNKKLLIACTTSSLKALEAMEFSRIFTTIVNVPTIKDPKQLKFVLIHYKLFDEKEIESILGNINQINISIKKLLSLSEIAIQIENRNDAVLKVIELLNDEFNYNTKFLSSRAFDC